VRCADELERAIERASEVADIIELRLDCFDEAELDVVRAALGALLSKRAQPFIFTFRPAAEGGRRALTADERRDFRRQLMFRHDGTPHAPDFADLESDFGDVDERQVEEVGQTCSVILSHHDFEGVPENLESIYEKMAATRAPVLKIAVRAGDITDCLTVFRLLERARREGREMIAVAMGEAGMLTRVLAPSRGSFLTYGALDEAQRTAPGQPSARELRDLYRIHSINRQTQVMGLVGSPVAHSVSPHMHNAALAALGTDGVYLPLEVGDLPAFLRRMAHPRTREFEWNLRGLSVTAPHKRAVLEHLDRIEPKALAIGAANTIIVKDGALCGENTDAEAAVVPLERMIELRGARVAVIGAGGAARAVLWGLRVRGAHPTVFARLTERAREAAAQFGSSAAPLGGAVFDGFEAVVNTTPLGTRGPLEDETPAVAAQLRGTRIVYDLVYNPAVTRFMREGLAAGCQSLGGLPMLVAQAAAQFKLWTGRDAPLEVMREAAERALEVREGK
jgi:3-dehydroquinate dehydratase/shikimate dehydrogenase